jgi:hypothetical protein
MLNEVIAGAVAAVALGVGQANPAPEAHPVREKQVLQIVLRDVPQRTVLVHPDDLIPSSDALSSTRPA